MNADKGKWVRVVVEVLAIATLCFVANFVLRQFVHAGILGSVQTELGKWSGKGVINVSLAWFIGVLGAFAFYFGVFTGFISPTSRTKILQYFGLGWKCGCFIAIFCITGGIVSAVFQAAQADTIAPIQAFVLGATWPSVVTRIMSGDGAATMSASKLSDASPDQIPTPRGQSVSAAEVVL